jgi:hypothetical protein
VHFLFGTGPPTPCGLWRSVVAFLVCGGASSWCLDAPADKEDDGAAIICQAVQMQLLSVKPCTTLSCIQIQTHTSGAHDQTMCSRAHQCNASSSLPLLHGNQSVGRLHVACHRALRRPRVPKKRHMLGRLQREKSHMHYAWIGHPLASSSRFS